MDNKEILEQSRAKFKLNMLAGFRSIPSVTIKEIPEKRTLFPGTDNDYWWKIELPNISSTACIYEIDKDRMFSPHIHFKRTELCMLMTKGSVVEVVTDTKIETVKFPNNLFFEKGEPHAVINKSGFKIFFLVVWQPKMEGMEIDFIKPSEDVITKIQEQL